jgi:DNA-binding transcriptional LysR family regulator
MKITIRQVRGFLALADTGSFTQAADRIGLSQPTLSQAIRDLEQNVGATLFDRTTRTVCLSEAGMAFQAGASRSLRELENAVSEVRALAELRGGRIRIASPPHMAGSLLPYAISDFNEEYPDVHVEISDVTVEQMLQRLRENQVDIAIGTIPSSSADLRVTRLFQEELMILCRHDHALTRIDSPSWADAERHPSVALVRGSGLRELTDSGFEQAGITYRPRWEVEQISTILGMLAKGLGTAILPRSALIGAEARGIVAIALNTPRVTRDISHACLSNRTLSPASAAFILQLRNVLQRVSIPVHPDRTFGNDSQTVKQAER